MGLEPTTLGTTIRCSNQLSYSHRHKVAKPLLRDRLLQIENLSLHRLLVNGSRSNKRDEFSVIARNDGFYGY